MASTTPFFLLLSSFAIFQMASARDSDITADFVTPLNLTNNLDGTYFTHTGMRALIDAQKPENFKVTKATMVEFPALSGQGVSLAILQYPAGTTNPPHIHPRATELLFLVEGTLEVGFVDTTNKLYNHIIQRGDIFVFPKGLVHFQYNPDASKPAVAVSSFGSANPGTISIPVNLFSSGIDNKILAKAFKTDVATIQALKTNLVPKP